MGLCLTCGGDGVIITCCDDICVGIGHCIHGDGEEVCPDCGGEGEVWDDDCRDDDWDDYECYLEEESPIAGDAGNHRQKQR